MESFTVPEELPTKALIEVGDAQDVRGELPLVFHTSDNRLMFLCSLTGFVCPRLYGGSRPVTEVMYAAEYEYAVDQCLEGDKGVG